MKQLMTTLEFLALALQLGRRARGAKRRLHGAGMGAEGDAGRRQALAFLLENDAPAPAARAERAAAASLA